MYPVTPRSSDRQNGTTYRMPVLKRSAGTVEKVLWRYDLPPGLTTELKRKADLRETSTITINLLELLGMVVTAWVMLEVTGDRPASIDPTAMRGGARDQRACLLMRMFGRLEVKGRWSHVAKHVPAVQKTLGGRYITLAPRRTGGKG